MYKKLTMRLGQVDIDYRKMSLFQGVIFENVSSEFADKMHQQNYHPYSQYLKKENEEWYWVITTLNDEAGEQIVNRFLNDIREFELRKIKLNIEIKEKRLIEENPKDLLEEFYSIPGEKYYNLRFLTSTAFKQNKSYNILPEPRLIYQSLMNKYSAVSEQVDMMDKQVLEELAIQSRVSRYKVSSVDFPMEGIKIPGFIGNVTLNVRGTDTLKRYARLLLRFGEYSGIGIKSSMGMGAVEINREERNG